MTGQLLAVSTNLTVSTVSAVSAVSGGFGRFRAASQIMERPRRSAATAAAAVWSALFSRGSAVPVQEADDMADDIDEVDANQDPIIEDGDGVDDDEGADAEAEGMERVIARAEVASGAWE